MNIDYDVKRPVRNLTLTSRVLGLDLGLEPQVLVKITGTRRFSFAAPVIWDNLPYNVRSAKTIETFTTRLKTPPVTASWTYAITPLISPFVKTSH